MIAPARRGRMTSPRLSDGAFDITYAARRPPLRLPPPDVGPTPPTLARARAAVGWRKLDARRARRAPCASPCPACASTSAASPRATRSTTPRRSCARRGIRHAIVSAGGDSRVIGDRRGRPWTIGIRDPRRARRRRRACCRSRTSSISTSGDYERYFDERRRALPPPDRPGDRHVAGAACTASPCSADDGLTTEALSKTVFVLGVEQGPGA